MTSSTDPQRVMTPEFRVSYPYLLEPQQPHKDNEDKTPKYGVTALFKTGEVFTAMKKAAQAALEKRFGERLKNPEFVKRLRSPFRDQADKAKFDEATGKEIMPAGHVKGAVFITLTNKEKPGLVDANVQPIIEPSQVYAGMYGRAMVRANAYEKKGNVGVAFYIEHFQKTRDGDSLTGRIKAEDAFEPIAAAESAGDDGAASMFSV